MGIAVPADPLEHSGGPVVLILLVDTSGSMDGMPMWFARQAAQTISRHLNDQARVALIQYGGIVSTTLDWTVGRSSPDKLNTAITGLVAAGGTPLVGALQRAFQKASEHVRSEMPGEPRIIYISDVSGNIGLHDMDAVLDAQPSETIRRTTISALGVGGFNYDDDAMETLANRANGTYHYVGSDTLLEQFQTHARNLLRKSPRDERVQIEFNARAVRKYRLIGYENRAVADQDFRDDSLDFGEPGFGRDVTALYEMRLQDDVQTGDPINLLTATVRWRDPLERHPGDRRVHPAGPGRDGHRRDVRVLQENRRGGRDCRDLAGVSLGRLHPRTVRHLRPGSHQNQRPSRPPDDRTGDAAGPDHTARRPQLLAQALPPLGPAERRPQQGDPTNPEGPLKRAWPPAGAGGPGAI